MKKYLSAFVCGFGAGVLQVVPVAKVFSFWLIIPAAAYLAIKLDQKASKDFSHILIGKAVVVGLLTGFYAALFGSFFDTFITFMTKSNYIVTFFPEFTNVLADFPIALSNLEKQQVMDMLTGMRDQILETGFSPLYTFYILFANLLFDTIFGILGGVIGAKIINAKNQPTAKL